MEVKTLQDIFVNILRSELCGAELDASVVEQITPDAVSALYSMSKIHDLSHVVSTYFRKHGLIKDEKLLSKFNKEEMVTLYRYERMKFTYRQICEIFDQASIPYIPLKGFVIRPYYPNELMRTSCDIDMLVKEVDLETAIEALVKQGFRKEQKNYHDVSMYSPTGVHLELHFNVQENIESIDTVLKDAWQYADMVEGSRYEFSKDFFIFHFFAHMSYHFSSGGCGIRPLMDLWVIEHKMGVTYRDAEELLKKAGIYKFAREISALVGVCFKGEPKDEWSDILTSYIVGGGLYGTLQSGIAAKREKEKSVFSYFLHRLFMPYGDMTVLFPILKKAPILLPFCWVIRFFKMMFTGKTSTSITEMRTVSHVTENEINNIRNIKEHLGL